MVEIYVPIFFYQSDSYISIIKTFDELHQGQKAKKNEKKIYLPHKDDIHWDGFGG